MKRICRKDQLAAKVIAHTFLCLFAAATLLPMVLSVVISFSSSESIQTKGYALIPSSFSLNAYRAIFETSRTLLRAYGVSIGVTAAGTFLNVLLTALIAYPLSRRDFAYRSPVSAFLFIPMMFGGGLVPVYILVVRYLGWKNTLLPMIVLPLVAPYTVFLLRVLFQGVPFSMLEAAKIDGASEWRTFCRIVLPLSRPAIATIALNYALAYWNDAFTPMIYLTDKRLYPLTLILNNIVSVVNKMKAQLLDPSKAGGVLADPNSIPSDTIIFAMMIVSTLPLAVLFTRMQKYFVKGLTVGSVKG